MSMPFPKYAKFAGRYCVCYYGYNYQYVLQLAMLRPLIEERLPGLSLWISCREPAKKLLKDQSRVLFDIDKRAFNHVYGMTDDMSSHPVWRLLVDSNLTDLHLKVGSDSESNLCLISTKAKPPVKQPDKDQVAKAMAYAVEQGYSITDNENVDLSTVGLVVGVENETLFLAAQAGIQTGLLPTGFGEPLYRMMFPDNKVL